MRLRGSVVLALTLLIMPIGVARADDVVTDSGTIEGVAVDPVFQALGGATVRIVGEAMVMTVHADAAGAIRVRGLPPGRYRIEVERGGFSHRPPDPPRVYRLTNDSAQRRGQYHRTLVHSCIGAMTPLRTFASPEQPKLAPLIDTTSTTLGVRLGRRDLLGY